MKRRGALLGFLGCCCLALTSVAGLAKTASTVTRTQTCPVPVIGLDADYVNLAGPAISAGGKAATYTLTASEEEAAKNTVTLSVKISAAHRSHVTTNPPKGSNKGAHDTAVKLLLPGGDSYTITWNAVFDNGIHPCSSSDPGHHPFKVTVAP